MGIVTLIFVGTISTFDPVLAHYCLVFMRVWCTHLHALIRVLTFIVMLGTLTLPCIGHEAHLIGSWLTAHLGTFLSSIVAHLPEAIWASLLVLERHHRLVRVHSSLSYFPDVFLYIHRGCVDIAFIILENKFIRGANICSCCLSIHHSMLWAIGRLDIIRASPGSAELLTSTLAVRWCLSIVIVCDLILGWKVIDLVCEHVVVWIIGAWWGFCSRAGITIGPSYFFLMIWLWELINLEQIFLVFEFDLNRWVVRLLSLVTVEWFAEGLFMGFRTGCGFGCW